MQGPNEQAEVARDMSIFNGCLSCYAIRRMKKCTENFIAKADPQTAFLAFFELRVRTRPFKVIILRLIRSSGLLRGCCCSASIRTDPYGKATVPAQRRPTRRKGSGHTLPITGLI